MLELTAEQRATMIAHAEEAYPNECCGLLIGRSQDGRRQIHAVLAAGNVHEDSTRNRYRITPEDYVRADKAARQMGCDILGFYHSHPDVPAQPSQYDLDHSTWPGWSFPIMSVNQGRVTDIRSWVKRDDGSQFDEEKVVGGQ